MEPVSAQTDTTDLSPASVFYNLTAISIVNNFVAIPLPYTSNQDTDDGSNKPTRLLLKDKKISNKTLEQKIKKAEEFKYECVKQIKKMEELEVPDGVEGEIFLEKIDKLRKKVLQLEESLMKHVVYTDAEYDETEDGQIAYDNTIVIMDTELEPLNQLLTEHVNNLVSSVDKSAGYRCVTMDALEDMLKKIAEAGDCPLYDYVVPKDKEQREIFLLQILERTNKRCRWEVFNQLLETYSSSGSTSKNIEAKRPKLTVDQNDQVDKLSYKPLSFGIEPSLSKKLSEMKSEGLLDETTDEAGEPIDLIVISDSDNDDDQDIDDVDDDEKSCTSKRPKINDVVDEKREERAKDEEKEMNIDLNNLDSVIEILDKSDDDEQTANKSDDVNNSNEDFENDIEIVGEVRPMELLRLRIFKNV